VEPRLQLIVGRGVDAAANDKEQIEPMVQVIDTERTATRASWPTVILLGEELEYLGLPPVGRPIEAISRTGRAA